VSSLTACSNSAREKIFM